MTRTRLIHALLLTLLGAGVFAAAFLYALIVVPLDTNIDIREAFVTVGGMALGIGIATLAWWRFLTWWLRHKRDERILAKQAEGKSPADSTVGGEAKTTPHYGSNRKRRKRAKSSGVRRNN